MLIYRVNEVLFKGVSEKTKLLLGQKWPTNFGSHTGVHSAWFHSTRSFVVFRVL